jgi:glycosyltransferase involved in cell wall biosynthesis
MKIALVHDWLTGMRGGERVLERLCALLPEADLFTLLWNRGSVSSVIESHAIRTSFVQHLPGAARHYRWYLPVFPRAIEQFDLTSYDLVISCSHCVAKGAIARRDALHVSYVLTPMRYVWDLEPVYFPPGRFPWPMDQAIRASCARLRAWDIATATRAQVMVATSLHAAARIARHWNRNVDVLHPPVSLARFQPVEGPRDYLLMAGALAPNKGGRLALEACRKLGRRLRVAGTGQEARALRRAAGPNVEFLGWVSDDDLAKLYAGASALLFPGEEDFGLVPVEAMASGCPVIALGRGGALETVARGASAEPLDAVARGGTAVVPGGVLFGTASVEGLTAAIALADRTRFEPETLRRLAEPFSAERFDREFVALLGRAQARGPTTGVRPGTPVPA